MGTMAMFPLGTVLFPSGLLPLHVFEPRYRAMVEDCLAGDEQFGVVLIERGSEVGGGDTRFDVGTVARIAEVNRLPDGRYALLARGTGRLRVREWLPDDPYPRADVEVVEEQPGGPDDEDARARVQQQLRRVLALASELGAAVPPGEVRLPDDPVAAAFAAAAVAPLGPLDAQELLAVDDPAARLDALDRLLDDAASLLALRLGER
jgi:uncharacterized protein